MFMELQRNILLFFSGINDNPFIFYTAKVISFLGNEFFPTFILLLIFWCIDKKKGVAGTLIALLASNISGIIKASVKAPRPWNVIDGLNAKEIEVEMGYSFPSGHSTNAGSVYGALAHHSKLYVLCIILIILIPLSRMVLCVHWLIDVVAGALLGLSVVFLFYRFLDKYLDEVMKYRKQFYLLGGLATFAGLTISIILQFFNGDPVAFTSLAKTLTMLGAALIFYTVEETRLGFSCNGSTKQKILRFLVGGLCCGAILYIPHLLLPEMALIKFIRYFAATAFAFLYPLIGVKIGLFEKPSAEN
jgi:undecaprenyl-diphosphatase